jgi:hypothetical protein
MKVKLYYYPEVKSMEMNSKLKINVSTRKISDLIPSEYNPRKISKNAKEKLRKSLNDFGYIDPIIINTFKGRENIIISGHQRYYIMKEDLVEEVDVVEVSMDPNKEKLLNIAMNNRNLMGEWDEEKLTQVVKDLFDNKIDLSLTGFGDLELDNILGTNVVFDPDKEWKDMPEYIQNEIMTKNRIIVLFDNNKDRMKFSELIGIKLTEKTKSIWFPEKENDNPSDYSYVEEDES